MFMLYKVILFTLLWYNHKIIIINEQHKKLTSGIDHKGDESVLFSSGA